MASSRLHAGFAAVCTLILAAHVAISPAAGASEGGRHLLQGGRGGAGGNGGAGGISFGGGQPGQGGAAGEGGEGGSPGGVPGADGVPGVTPGVVRPPPSQPPPRPSCNKGEFVLQGRCSKCTSNGKKASFRGVTCTNPEAFKSPSSCSAGTLFGVKIQSISKKDEFKECATTLVFKAEDSGRTNAIGGGNVRVSLLLPKQNSTALSGLTADRYKSSTISLAGVPAKQLRVETIKGEKYARVDFDDTKGELRGLKGKDARLTGVYERKDGVKLCFASKVKICK